MSIKKQCIYCGSKKLSKAGKTGSGSQRVICKNPNCPKSGLPWTINPKIKTFPPVIGINCPTCNGEHLHRNGTSKDGRVKFRCQGCGRQFVLIRKKRGRKPSIKE